jgi:hypothetical protein
MNENTPGHGDRGCYAEGDYSVVVVTVAVLVLVGLRRLLQTAVSVVQDVPTPPNRALRRRPEHPAVRRCR